ncbi:MAG: hypothetical protein A2020_08135 [Lentisphaerae bacterium GWF2_45_14]|nr:MAG: hypothetical protein A2020_08135 [Lentisphaerae bacterium GWF2_45_14]
MAEFLYPFQTLIPERKLSGRELSRCIRQALVGEEEAIHLYEAMADAADDPLAQAVLQDIADEERVHAGEFQRLLNIMLPDEEKFLNQGAEEVDELAGTVRKVDESPQKEENKAIPVPGDCR